VFLGASRRVAAAGGLYINNNRITDVNYLIESSDIIHNCMIVRSGKSKQAVIILSEQNSL
jgi:tyrosyl-tRNA synthetase